MPKLFPKYFGYFLLKVVAVNCQKLPNLVTLGGVLALQRVRRRRRKVEQVRSNKSAFAGIH